MKDKKDEITASADKADASKGERVPLCLMLSSEEFRQRRGLPVAFGRDLAGRYLVGDLFKLRHLLLTGGTGAERTACLNAVLLSSLCRCSPADLRILLIDPERQLEVYRGLPHLQGDPADDGGQITAALIWAINETDRRYEMFIEERRAGKNANNFTEYNAIPSVQKLPLILVVLNVRDGRLKEENLSGLIRRLVQKCWAAGVCVILATDRAFSPEENFFTHITFSSRGAGREGELTLCTAGTELRAQGAFVTPAELGTAVEEIKARHSKRPGPAPADFIEKKTDPNRRINKVFGMISLGCDKNRVDGERILGEIKAHGCPITDTLEEAQILVVNTCAFLNAARKEAIETVLEGNSYRSGKLEKIVVSGCLPEKFISELYPALTEADVFLGISDVSELFPALERAYAGERVNAVGKGDGAASKRLVSTPAHYKYLKISEGCSNHCTYCLIPKIRGKYRSYPMEELLHEAASLGRTEELILVAQDTTRYGEDLGQNLFVPLLKKLSELDNICHIRLLYCYPEKITDELIAEIAENDKILKYLDIPLQHADDAILRRMGRMGSRAEYLSLIAKLRREIPQITIRSTFIAGFPGETEEQHKNLLSFLEEAGLQNCGFFAYSREPETPAYRMEGQVHPSVKKRRVKELYAAQEKISAAFTAGFVGKETEVLCDGIEYEKGLFQGRTYFQAPEIDGCVYFTAAHAEEGKRYKVLVDRAEPYDLYGSVK